MSIDYTRLKWWQAYLALPLLIVLFILDSRLKLSERGHQAVQIGIVLLVYGLVHLCLKASEAALTDTRRYRGVVTFSNTRAYKLMNMNNEKRSIFQMSDSEIKGTLSDTFEMDYVDAEFFSLDEVSQELNKE